MALLVSVWNISFDYTQLHVGGDLWIIYDFYVQSHQLLINNYVLDKIKRNKLSVFPY